MPERSNGHAVVAHGLPRRIQSLGVLASIMLLPGLAGAAYPQQTEPQAHASAAAFDALAESGGLKASGAFPFDYQYLVFSEGTPDAVTVWAAASVHAGRVRGVFEGGWKYALSITVELFDGDALVASDTRVVRHVLSSRIPDWVSDGFPVQARVTVPPGEYRYRLSVQDLNWPEDRAVNRVEGSLTVPYFDVSRPIVSSVAIAADSGGTWSPAPGINLKLNAAAIVTQTARPFVYYEVYGLTPGGAYRGDVRLVSTWRSLGRGEEFRGPYQPFQMQYRGTVPADPDTPVRGVLRLDMSKTEPGPYEVHVRITDVETGELSEVRRVGLKVRAPDARRPPPVISEIDTGSGGGSEGS